MRTIRGKSTLCLVGRSADHLTFALLVSEVTAGFSIRTSDLSAALSALPGLANCARADIGRTTIDGEPCVRFALETDRAARDSADRLRRSGIRTYEADIDTVDAYLMDHGIHGSLTIRGEYRAGRHIDRVYFDPSVEPAVWQPELSVMSVDIETRTRIVAGTALTESIMVIAFRLSASWLNEPIQEVLYAGIPHFDADASGNGPRMTATECGSEKELIAAFFDRVRTTDPDIITGWNVVDFDWRELADRAIALGVDLTIGRSDEAARFFAARPAANSRRREESDDDEVPIDPGPAATASMIIPGRQVIDGLRLLRYGPQNFREQSLQFVAQSVLGVGKSIEYESSTGKLAEIDRMSREDPAALCSYCLQDAILVSDILAKTGLLDLTVMRCLLIGVSLSRAWMSIRSFDFIYIEAMHRRGLVAPTLGVDALALEGAPGGAILTPEPGVFDNVMVFDFKSLYPSVIRTFNIDPVGLVSAPKPSAHEQIDRQAFIVAPNEAAFSRDPGILPELLDRFFSKREEAKRKGDQVASFVYKIIMNSFYGVLGAGGCRFAGTALAGAITGLGQRVLRWCKRLLVDSGYNVIYGDTDSLFVIAQGADDNADIFAEGAQLARLVNDRLAEFVRTEYGVESRLELEFEKVYRRFFLPALRVQPSSEGSQEPQAVRGRAKGYAGLIAMRNDAAGTLRDRIEVKGMEAVRRDWTPLAQEFQMTILEALFDDREPAERTALLAGRIRELVRSLRTGAHDAELVYTRSLRKSVSGYTKSQPPHVKAALLLPPSERRGTIRYLITTAGPQPMTRRTSPIDYEHYVEKQLRPIAQAFVDSIGPVVVDALGEERQLSLFDR